MTKQENPSGYFDFVWSGAIVRDFESYFVRVPISMEKYPDIDAKYGLSADPNELVGRTVGAAWNATACFGQAICCIGDGTSIGGDYGDV
jgi:hypothetical protein